MVEVESESEAEVVEAEVVEVESESEGESDKGESDDRKVKAKQSRATAAAARQMQSLSDKVAALFTKSEQRFGQTSRRALTALNAAGSAIEKHATEASRLMDSSSSAQRAEFVDLVAVMNSRLAKVREKRNELEKELSAKTKTPKRSGKGGQVNQRKRLRSGTDKEFGEATRAWVEATKEVETVETVEAKLEEVDKLRAILDTALMRSRCALHQGLALAGEGVFGEACCHFAGDSSFVASLCEEERETLVKYSQAGAGAGAGTGVTYDGLNKQRLADLLRVVASPDTSIPKRLAQFISVFECPCGKAFYASPTADDTTVTHDLAQGHSDGMGHCQGGGSSEGRAAVPLHAVLRVEKKGILGPLTAIGLQATAPGVVSAFGGKVVFEEVA